MADTKISALTAATTPLAGTEVLPIVQSGSTVKVTNNDLRPKQIQSNATSGVLQIAGPAAASTRVMTTPDANFTAARTDAAQSFTGDQTLATGNLIQGTAAKGINFTANSAAAGMTSQLLNWYEEGTWTPAFSATGLSGITYGSNTVGRYTRVGRLVTISFYLYTTGTFTKGSAALSITGLPFTSANVTGLYATVSLWNATRFDATPPVVGGIPNNATTIALYSSFNATGAGTDPVAVSSANMRSAAGENCNFVAGTATYMV